MLNNFARLRALSGSGRKKRRTFVFITCSSLRDSTSSVFLSLFFCLVPCVKRSWHFNSFWASALNAEPCGVFSAPIDLYLLYAELEILYSARTPRREHVKLLDWTFRNLWRNVVFHGKVYRATQLLAAELKSPCRIPTKSICAANRVASCRNPSTLITVAWLKTIL